MDITTPWCANRRGSRQQNWKVGQNGNRKNGFQDSRLRLCGDSLVQTERVERAGEVIVHVLVKVHAARAALRLVVTAVRAAGIAGRRR